MVYSNEYQQIRRIFKKDVRAVMSLIRQSVQRGAHASNARRDSRATGVAARGRPQCGCLRSPMSIRRMRPANLPASTLTRHTRTKDMVKSSWLSPKTRAEKALSDSCPFHPGVQLSPAKGGFIEGSAEDLPAERRLKYEASGRNRRSFKPIAAGIN